MTTSQDDEPPRIQVVIENAEYDIKRKRAKQHAALQLVKLSAAILRTIAGSPSAPPIMPALLDLFDAQKHLVELSGEVLPHNDEKEALRLFEAQPPLDKDDRSELRYREFEYSAGMEAIVRGALRVAAHQILREHEHFGGKYSTMEIERGIALIMRSQGPSPNKRRR